MESPAVLRRPTALPNILRRHMHRPPPGKMMPGMTRTLKSEMKHLRKSAPVYA